MQWPDFFPEGCPPDNARPANGDVFRLISAARPKEKDFKSYWELGRATDSCVSCGLSVYTDSSDILRLFNRIPGLRKKKVIIGTLKPEMGQIKKTANYERSHHTWWLPEGIQPWFSFQVVEIRDN